MNSEYGSVPYTTWYRTLEQDRTQAIQRDERTTRDSLTTNRTLSDPCEDRLHAHAHIRRAISNLPLEADPLDPRSAQVVFVPLHRGQTGLGAAPCDPARMLRRKRPSTIFGCVANYEMWGGYDLGIMPTHKILLAV